MYATDEDADETFYCLDFFPYPSGAGLSVGHMRNYVPTDVYSRFKRMNGFAVLHPMGWDAFGFPAENYARRQGVHPRVSTDENVANYRRQMALAELSYDWSREVDSTDPAYYRWTQWIFRLLFERGYAYQADGLQWWCDECRSVLANEQVVDGCCWRHDDRPVTRKYLRQWYFRITAYAEALLAGLERVDWPEHIKKQQRDWIGRSEGCEVRFEGTNPDTGASFDLPTFTTRVDTVCGVTYLVVAPEHPMVERLVTAEHGSAVEAYVRDALSCSEVARLATDRPKVGVPTGSFARNPVNGRDVPVWLADYVVASYGTGIVMAVPAHDERDQAFARRYGLAVVSVIDDEFLHDSAPFDGLSTAEARTAIAAWLAERGAGGPTVSYKMRDWLISRQRYWGAPIPVVHCEDCGAVAVPEGDLPVLLPDMTVSAMEPSGTGASPLASCRDFVATTCPQCGKPAKRETDTMDGFACSSWYFLRFADPHNATASFSPEAVARWLPVDLYVGGAEQAVMHLLYARFWTKVLHDVGLLPFDEPFAKLRNQGAMLAADGRRMAKNKGNVVTPDEVADAWGADCLRTYVLFLGRFDQNVTWNDEGVAGMSRFLERVWHMVQRHPGRGSEEAGEGGRALRRTVHETVRRVTDDVEGFAFNTALSALMTCQREMSAQAERDPTLPSTDVWAEAVDAVLTLLAPFAPFIAAELWERTGRTGDVHRQSWPRVDEAALRRDEVRYPVKIGGRVRDTVVVAADADEAAIRQAVLASPAVCRYLEGKTVERFLVVPGRLICVDLKPV